MAGLKYYERTLRIMELIEKQKTGTPQELATKLGVTERTVYNIMEAIRESSFGSIEYSKFDRSYVFTNKNVGTN